MDNQNNREFFSLISGTNLFFRVVPLTKKRVLVSPFA